MVNLSQEQVTRFEEFAEECLGNDRVEFTYEEALKLAREAGFSVALPAIQWLKDFGMTMAVREPAKSVRGFRSSNHDRYFGPGSSPMHGGSGYEQISGFAGQEG